MEQNLNRAKALVNLLKQHSYSKELELSDIYAKSIPYEQRETVLESVKEAGWEPFGNGSRWGGKDIHTCFQTVYEVSKEQEGKELWLFVETGATDIWNTDNPQFLAYINGEIICGMDMNHNQVLVTRKAALGEKIQIGLYGYSNSDEVTDHLRLDIRERFEIVEKLYFDCKVILDSIENMRLDDSARAELLACLDQVERKLNLLQVPGEHFYESVKEASEWLDENFPTSEKIRSSEYEAVTVHSIGHTHIDVAWKWPVRQTREKALRSFSTVLDLMDQYPDYRFMASTPQLYQFVKEESPTQYERIKKRIAEGRWEVEGSMWLEADCNLTSGESLVRQILYGKAFFEQEFGKGDNRVLWLPDVFGYSAAMPQIMKKAGIDYFMTTKIGWNENNRFPHDAFMWRGIDGSEVLTYLITTTDYKVYPEFDMVKNHSTTYNGLQNVKQIKGTWQRFTDKQLTKQVLTCFGHGDGGGGATREMLEFDKRMKKGLPGVPKTKQTFVKEYFDLLKEDVADKTLPKWSGELYLEYHRGTYTSMAKNKKYNRLCENQLMALETLASLALVHGEDYIYPKDELLKNWQVLMLNQFHDILPGSSIEEVYDTTTEEYEALIQSNEKLLGEALEALGFRREEKELPFEQKTVLLYNPLGFARNMRIQTPKGIAMSEIIPAKGFGIVSGAELLDRIEDAKKDLVVENDKSDGSLKIETPFYQARISAHGEITSLFDKKQKREIALGALNQMIAYEDRPWEYDCWNIDSDYERKAYPVGDVTLLAGFTTNETIEITVEKKFLNSTIEQKICFYANSSRIDFDTRVDWQERQVLLRTLFPLDVLSDKVTCDIQYGNIERATHRNTSWDEARFEFCAHKWVDLSEGNYGVALLNDCKYGYSAKESTLGLTLIKSGIYPNENADLGIHTFTYSLLPHEGDFRKGQVVREAFDLNVPMVVLPVEQPNVEITKKLETLLGGLKASPEIINKENIIVETIKQAEDGDGFIFRLYECFGNRENYELDLSAFQPKAVSVENLLEQKLEETYEGAKVSLVDGKVIGQIKPYEILTLRVKL